MEHVSSQVPSGQRIKFGGQAKTAMGTRSFATHLSKMESNIGVLPEHAPARDCRYDLNAVADEAQAAIDV